MFRLPNMEYYLLNYMTLLRVLLIVIIIEALDLTWCSIPEIPTVAENSSIRVRGIISLSRTAGKYAYFFINFQESKYLSFFEKVQTIQFKQFFMLIM